MVLPALNLSTLNADILISNDATSKINDVLTEHGGLLHVLPLTVHLRFFCWTSSGNHSEPFLLFEFFCGTPPSCLKVIGGVVVAYKILESAQGPLPLVLGLGLKG